MTALWVRKAFINHRGNYPEGVLCYTAMKGFALLGLEIEPFYGFGDLGEKHAAGDLTDDTLVVGFVGDVRQAIELLGHPSPDTPDYPEELSDELYLGRKIWLSDMKTVRGETRRLFIKPVKHKLFTGHVKGPDYADLIRTASVPEDEEVWVSEPLDFISEYRCYIMNGELIGIRWYKGNPFVSPSRHLVELALKAWTTAPAACTLDFGIVDSGETFLIEANDGFAFGNYGLPPVTYARMLEARWREMVGGPPSPPLETSDDSHYR